LITDLLNMDNRSETTAHVVANYFAERGAFNYSRNLCWRNWAIWFRIRSKL